MPRRLFPNERYCPGFDAGLDSLPVFGHFIPMSTVAEIEEAIARLPAGDFAQLLEDLRDIEAARSALSEASVTGETPKEWSHLRAELDALHG